jgi:hypothetical protein
MCRSFKSTVHPLLEPRLWIETYTYAPAPQPSLHGAVYLDVQAPGFRACFPLSPSEARVLATQLQAAATQAEADAAAASAPDAAAQDASRA